MLLEGLPKSLDLGIGGREDMARTVGCQSLRGGGRPWRGCAPGEEPGSQRGLACCQHRALVKCRLPVEPPPRFVGLRSLPPSHFPPQRERTWARGAAQLPGRPVGKALQPCTRARRPWTSRTVLRVGGREGAAWQRCSYAQARNATQHHKRAPWEPPLVLQPSSPSHHNRCLDEGHGGGWVQSAERTVRQVPPGTSSPCSMHRGCLLGCKPAIHVPTISSRMRAAFAVSPRTHRLSMIVAQPSARRSDTWRSLDPCCSAGRLRRERGAGHDEPAVAPGRPRMSPSLHAARPATHGPSRQLFPRAWSRRKATRAPWLPLHAASWATRAAGACPSRGPRSRPGGARLRCGSPE